jgi:hypothetical protein
MITLSNPATGASISQPLDLTALMAPVPPTPSSGCALGATIISNGTWAGPTNSVLDDFEHAIGRRLAVVNSGGGGSLPQAFSRVPADWLRARGTAIMPTVMTSTRCTTVTGGTFDANLRQMAVDAKAWGHPYYLRFCHEMNGDWYGYGVKNSHNGNTAAAYVAMWKHVHDIFSNVGANNVKWVWCPDVTNQAAYASLFPGDAYVDYVGCDAYDKATTRQQPLDLFAGAYKALTALSSRPIVIGETGTKSEYGAAYKATWLRNLIPAVQAMPRIAALMVFSALWPNDGDWRIDTPTALAAFAEVAASPAFAGTLP